MYRALSAASTEGSSLWRHGSSSVGVVRAALAVAAEFVGGILIILGLAGRLVALLSPRHLYHGRDGRPRAGRVSICRRKCPSGTTA